MLLRVCDATHQKVCGIYLLRNVAVDDVDHRERFFTRSSRTAKNAGGKGGWSPAPARSERKGVGSRMFSQRGTSRFDDGDADGYRTPNPLRESQQLRRSIRSTLVGNPIRRLARETRESSRELSKSTPGKPGEATDRILGEPNVAPEYQHGEGTDRGRGGTTFIQQLRKGLSGVREGNSTSDVGGARAISPASRDEFRRSPLFSPRGGGTWSPPSPQASADHSPASSVGGDSEVTEEPAIKQSRWPQSRPTTCDERSTGH
jgi:hypothetical protein